MIPLARPDIAFDDVADDIKAILESGWLTSGAYVQRFEEAFAAYIGVRHALTTTSATTALHLSLVASGVEPGDEVLVSDFSFPASGNVIVQAGAVPVLVDCAPGRFTLDVEDAARKVTTKTRAIMPVDPFGQPADMAAVCALAEAHDLFVVEDAACAVGADRDRKKAGAWQGAGCFSFHPRKIITTGEGGMITTDDDAFVARARRLRSHGGVAASIGLEFTENGYNYRMSEIQAALGLAQMKKLDAFLEDRKATARAYSDRLRDVEGVLLPLDAEKGTGTYQSYVVQLDDHIDRDRIIAIMRTKGVETTLGTYAMHAHPAFARFGYAAGDLPNSWRSQRQSLTLPLLPRMAEGEVNRITEAFISAYL